MNPGMCCLTGYVLPTPRAAGAANASIPRGLTALHDAATHGWVEGLQALLATGTARDARVDDMLATQAFLRAFPHLGTLDPFGFLYRHVPDGCTALHLAAVQGYAAVGVLLEVGLEVDAEDSRASHRWAACASWRIRAQTCCRWQRCCWLPVPAACDRSLMAMHAQSWLALPRSWPRTHSHSCTKRCSRSGSRCGAASGAAAANQRERLHQQWQLAACPPS